MIELHNLNPLTERIFGKENIRQIVREYLPVENIEENIEHYERHFMNALYQYVNWGMCISKSCYKRILNEKEDDLTEEYITLLKEGVKDNFFNCQFSFGSLKYNSYFCTETIGDLFFEGEIYKEVLNRFNKGSKGTHGRLENFTGKEIKKVEGLHLIPQKGNKHLIIPNELIGNFKKIIK